LIAKDTVNSFIEKGDRFDINVLEKERKRISEYLKNQGYYDFSKKYIFFQADTTVPGQKVNLTIEIKKYRIRKNGTVVKKTVHPKYKINKIFVVTDYNKEEVLKNKEKFYQTLDTVRYDSLYFLYHDELSIKPGVIAQSVYVNQHSVYNNNDVEKTYQHLSSLQILRLVNILFTKKNDTVADADSALRFKNLNCTIRLTPALSQSYTVNIEGTNSSGDIGMAGNLIYKHRNLFHGAEVFNFRIRGGIEAVKERYKGRLDNTMELGTELRLQIPRFILPVKGDNFVKKYNPSTSFSLSYNFQQRPDYTRRIINGSYGYNWKGSDIISHRINPIEINLVKLLESTEQFRKQINTNPFLKKSYEEHFIAVTNYSFIYNDQNIKKNTDFVFFRFNFESAGNIVTGVNELLNTEKQEGAYHLLGNKYAQYLKSDIDLRYYHQLNPSDKLVYRFFAGAGYPYGNSSVMLFEKKYFSGGANSIRAWQVRALGPGSYKEEEYTPFPNNLADIKLEGNIEYRFNMFWVLEGALFTDMGNIWAIRSNDARPGALFKGDFYKDIAVGSGFGTRFDFSFFIFRVDFGFKIRDPGRQTKKWIFSQKHINSRDFSINVGIGYPF
jgi:outer membrane protein assembly factor BamA